MHSLSLFCTTEKATKKNMAAESEVVTMYESIEDMITSSFINKQPSVQFQLKHQSPLENYHQDFTSLKSSADDIYESCNPSESIQQEQVIRRYLLNIILDNLFFSFIVAAI